MTTRTKMLVFEAVIACCFFSSCLTFLKESASPRTWLDDIYDQGQAAERLDPETRLWDAILSRQSRLAGAHVLAAWRAHSARPWEQKHFSGIILCNLGDRRYGEAGRSVVIAHDCPMYYQQTTEPWWPLGLQQNPVDGHSTVQCPRDRYAYISVSFDSCIPRGIRWTSGGEPLMVLGITGSAGDSDARIWAHRGYYR